MCDPIFYGHFLVILIMTNNGHVINYLLVVSLERSPLVITSCSIVEVLKITLGDDIC